MGSSREPGQVLNLLEHDGTEFTAIVLQMPMRRIEGGDDVWFRGRVYTVQDIFEDRVVLSDREGFVAVGHAMWWELRVASLVEVFKN